MKRANYNFVLTVKQLNLNVILKLREANIGQAPRNESVISLVS